MAIKRMQVSVTVSRLGGDLPVDKWQRAARAIMNHPGVHKTAIAYERGTEQENGHMQAVMEVDASSTAAVHNKLEAAWKVALEPKTVTPNDMETIFFAKPTFDARYFNMDFSDEYKELEDHIEKQNPLERLLPYFPPELQLAQQLRQGTASRQDRQELFHPIFGALGCTEEELLAAQADIENGPPVEEADIETAVRLHAEAGYIPVLPASLSARHKFMSNLTLQIPCGFCGGTIKFLLPQFDDVVHKRKMFCQECDDKRTAARNTRREADAAATASGAVAPALQPSFLPADAVAALAAFQRALQASTGAAGPDLMTPSPARTTPSSLVTDEELQLPGMEAVLERLQAAADAAGGDGGSANGSVGGPSISGSVQGASQQSDENIDADGEAA
ncbi:hypothetical protein GPECTOR_1065g343 [Gonium pectorale]|uniref:Replitron HUH endonuclease domain-containing protein n=1 Tax=Gonium pectorale TaxID=33097 RepID=A0A150FTP3_GONPE|nr:hypothetical protein GPECTOR_1065g343 [Gonium pectorale]|eukprot:KXZ40974.1 hypothetical protein GPECTOR_1065g343 [Gonium pectorale]